MKTNKEIVDALQEYFLQQDPKIVARLLANFFIDFNRLVNIDKLPEMEKFWLRRRIQHNVDQLHKFVKGDRSALTCENVET